jgi:hypothetical protein
MPWADAALLTLDRDERDDDVLSMRLAVLRVMMCSDVRRPGIWKRGGRRTEVWWVEVEVEVALAAAVVDDEPAAASCDDGGGGPMVRGLVGGDSSIRDEVVEARYAAKSKGGGRWNCPLVRWP